MKYAGSYSQPEWRGSGSLSWDYKDLNLTFTANYVGESDQAFMISQKYVSDIWTYDVQVSYNFRDMKNQALVWLNDTRITVGVQNLLDEDPPFSDYSGDNGGYDTAWGDPRGRFFYASINKKF